MYSSGARRTKANKRRAAGVLRWSKPRADRDQQSPVGQLNSPLLVVHMQSVRSRRANSLLSSVDGANVCVASIGEADISRHREELQP